MKATKSAIFYTSLFMSTAVALFPISDAHAVHPMIKYFKGLNGTDEDNWAQTERKYAASGAAQVRKVLNAANIFRPVVATRVTAAKALFELLRTMVFYQHMLSNSKTYLTSFLLEKINGVLSMITSQRL